jgi:hypothetical protein
MQSVRRASVEDADLINEWFWREFGCRNRAIEEYLNDRNNVCLIAGEGGVLFVWRAPGTYEVHVFFKQRGREVLNLSHRLLDWMRREMGARRFWAAIPEGSRKVIWFTRLMGWKFREQRTFAHGPCQVYEGE